MIIVLVLLGLFKSVAHQIPLELLIMSTLGGSCESGISSIIPVGIHSWKPSITQKGYRMSVPRPILKKSKVQFRASVMTGSDLQAEGYPVPVNPVDTSHLV